MTKPVDRPKKKREWTPEQREKSRQQMLKLRAKQRQQRGLAERPTPEEELEKAGAVVEGLMAHQGLDRDNALLRAQARLRWDDDLTAQVERHLWPEEVTS